MLMLENATPRMAAEFAVKTEQLGEQVYQALARKYAADPELKGLFETLAREERAHGDQFSVLAESIPADAQVTSADERLQYLRAMSISAFFKGGNRLFDDIDQIADREDALLRALDLEKSTLLYYQALQDVIGQSTTLAFVLEAEKGHIMKISQWLWTHRKKQG